MHQLPKTAVPALVGWVGVCSGAVFFIGGVLAGFQAEYLLLTAILATALPMWALQWNRECVRLEPVARGEAFWGWLALVVMGALLLAFQLQMGGEKGRAVLSILPLMAGVAVLGAVVAVLKPSLLGCTIPDVWLATRALLGRRGISDEQRTSLMGWGVKLFFVPLMIAWSLTWTRDLLHDWDWSRPAVWFVLPLTVMYTIDVLFGTIGYLSTASKIGGQIRSVDTTRSGWIAALSCYPPFLALTADGLLNYRVGSDWKCWLEPGSGLFVVWGSIILLLTGIYVWSTVSFGPRFSNLTNRGIITSGPYRWFKHPAYFSKNLSWWMMAVPFAGESGLGVALVSCIGLLGVNAIYWIRAKTEERHLMMDPDYVRYSAWINLYGGVALLSGVFLSGVHKLRAR